MTAPPGLNTLIRNSANLALTTVVTGGLGYVYWVAAARVFSPSTVGLTSALVSAILLLTAVSNMGLGLGLAYVLPGAEHRWGALVSSVLSATALLAVMLTVAFALGSGLLGLDIGLAAKSPAFVAVFVATSAAWAVGVVVDQVLTIENRTGLSLARNGISSVFRLILLPLVIALPFPEAQVILLVAAWGIGAVVSLVVTALIFFRKSPHRLRWVLDVRAIRELVPVSLSNHVLITVAAVPGYVLPLVVTGLVSPEANAYFYTAWMISMLVRTIPTSVATALFAHGASAKQMDRTTLNHLLLLTLGLMVPAAIVLGLFRDTVLSLFGRQYATNADLLLMILLASAIPGAVTQIYAVAQRIRLRFRAALVVTMISTALSIGLVYVVVPLYGLTGAGIALFIGNLSVVPFCYYDLWIRREPPERIGEEPESKSAVLVSGDARPSSFDGGE